MTAEAKLPVDVDAEEHIIAYALTDPEGRAELLDAVEAGEFASPARGALWHQMRALASEHGQAAVDEVLVRGRVRQLKARDAVETRNVLDHIAGTVTLNLPPDPLGTARMEKAATVKRLARQRHGIAMLLEGLAPLYQRDCDPVDTVAGLDAALRGLVDDWQFSSTNGHRQHGTSAASGKTARYVVLTDTEVEGFKPAAGLVGDILFADSVAFLFAGKDTWKSFLAVSWACCIGANVEWLGRRVQPGLVVYVAAEGRRGIGKRIKAWKRHHGIHRSVDVVVVPMPVNLLDSAAIPDLMAALEAYPRIQGRKPVLVVFDTLARSMDGGDENDTKAANAVTAAAGLLKARYECCVLIVHHSGHSAQDRMRGNSALGANADIVMRIMAPSLAEGQRREAGSVVTLHSVHAKETDCFEDVKFTTVLEKWTDDQGNSDSSLAIVPPDDEQVKAHEKKAQQDRMPVKGAQLTALKALVAAEDGLGAEDWRRASKLGKSTFYTAMRMLTQKLGAAKCDPDDQKYRVTDAGREWAR